MNSKGKGKQGYCHKHYDLSHNRGIIDAREAVERVALLRERGYSLDDLAEMTGIHRQVFTYLGQWTEDGGLQANTHRAIMSIPVPGGVVAGRAKSVPNIGVRRRIQALIAYGYSYEDLAKELGIGGGAVSNYLLRDRLRPDVVVRVAELFERLQFTPGPRSRSAAHGRRMGWALPMEWDEDDLDDPEGQPTVNRDVKSSGRWHASYWELYDMGIRDRAKMAERLGVPFKTLERQITRWQAEGRYG